MTVITQITESTYVANGSTLVFAYNFRILDESHLKVYADEVIVDSADYTVTGVGAASGGDVDFTPSGAPTNGTIIRLSREIPITQLVDYQPNDPFPADTHEAALDKLTMITQQHRTELDRTIQATPGNGGVVFEFTDPKANTILAFNDDGTVVINQPTAEELAYRWAETPEDEVVAVKGGQNRYSAYHWAVKAFNAVELPLTNRGDIMVGDGTSSPATILPLGVQDSFLRSDIDTPGNPTGLLWATVPQALPSTPAGSKMKILHVKADETGFELAPQYAATLIHAKDFQEDDESTGDTTAFHVPHYQNIAMSFESPDAKMRAGHLVGVPVLNHENVDYDLLIVGSIGIGEAALTGTQVKLEITPYLFWSDGTPSGLNPLAGTPVSVEFAPTKNDATMTLVTFSNLIPMAGTVHDVFASLKVRRVTAAGTDFEGAFNIISAQMIPA